VFRCQTTEDRCITWVAIEDEHEDEEEEEENKISYSSSYSSSRIASHLTPDTRNLKPVLFLKDFQI